MKRRHLLGGILLAFGCTSTGRRLEDAPAEAEPPAPEPVPEPEPLAPFAADGPAPESGLARRPLLVLVIPEDNGDRWRRGRVYGEILNHGDDASLAPLALFEVLCAPMSTLRAQYGELRAKGDPWLVVVDRTRPNPRARPLTDDDLTALANLSEPTDKDIDARMARIAELFRRAAETDMVKRLAALERSALTPTVTDELRTTTEDLVQPRLAVAAAAAGVLFAWAFLPAKDEDDYEWLREQRHGIASGALAAAVRDRLVRTQPPKGASWARSSGCGTRVEGAKEHHAVGCGMGHVPERSQRFLSFLTAEELN